MPRRRSRQRDLETLGSAFFIGVYAMRYVLWMLDHGHVGYHVWEAELGPLQRWEAPVSESRLCGLRDILRPKASRDPLP